MTKAILGEREMTRAILMEREMTRAVFGEREMTRAVFGEREIDYERWRAWACVVFRTCSGARERFVCRGC